MSFFGLSVKTQAWLRTERNTYLPLFEWLMLKIYSWLPLFYCFGLFVLHKLFTEFLIYFKERLEIGLWNKGIFELRIGTCELFTIIMYRLKLHSKGTPQSQCINKKTADVSSHFCSRLSYSTENHDWALFEKCTQKQVARKMQTNIWEWKSKGRVSTSHQDWLLPLHIGYNTVFKWY